MTVSAAFLVKDPPMDRLALLVEYLRPVASEFVFVVDDRTAAETSAVLGGWGPTIPFAWIDDFSAARNAALPRCTGDWVLIVDPDELPSLAMLDFIRLVDQTPNDDVDWQGVRYWSPRGYLFFTKNFYSGVQGPEFEEHWHCRLFRRGSGFFYNRVHELVALDGMPEDMMRNTPMLPKAPKSACLIHSNMDGSGKGDAYAAIEALA